ncbi:MAG: DEAD/DEAH box helicase [Spirochaetes bacterium GWD1_61_31]|nr:MAG: DEAD/DEAH box helicase [Spirochaetes bacterium GWB1_60_80]OHD29642.1 MAG: DEAD/DEAH box helicase [Spirochaetes bacterium GWC1_61_12]OHD37547.1 MAG: DEAD/DEAH box helicase [Spirochaetes bacterium GWD1_61_31]OHD41943.1 MAG: DEAD/DEAH box helicase [Spirochaetes bacterium GWE1_60_18]OHD61790.1 MAG: DEAD/DEAH box helicase [Spirochaetes bacterium GWF1_60_12]
MNPTQLPVYQQKQSILDALAKNQVIVVESPTGSGKTTQLPVILHEAGYADHGIIGVTQPRRIAAISVSEFISWQLATPMPGLVGYKMRFEDKTDHNTKIKIMTDGILLQEMKLDPLLSRYSVIMVDEAHERSLNIDFILGLLKRVLEARPEFKVIVSSATINADIFRAYFSDCPLVKIDTQIYPVTIVIDPPALEANLESLVAKIEDIVNRIVASERPGDLLIFLPGEKAIKTVMQVLAACPVNEKLHLIPLYSRLGKDEQQRVFEKAPEGKHKVIVSTNIAETSVTIDGVTSVIDSGQAKLNFYNPKTFTASLVEVPISKASCNQRKGRAGRTAPGYCYRLFTRDDFENRPLFTMEEIYRTDLSEVVLRMAELGISDFENFDFISRPNRSGIHGAVEILDLLGSLHTDRSLTKVGQMMCAFPLLPRLSRMIVEAVLQYPDVLEEVLIAASFLSTQSPYVLPQGEELEARRAHHAFRDPAGDFLSYLRMFKAFLAAKHKAKFAEQSYLDERTMLEIVRIKEQLELIVNSLGVPIGHGGSTENYLCAVSRGLIQFVCARAERGVFRTLMGERVQIHPGSVMFKENPEYLVAGEIVRTTRMYAMSVSPLQKRMLNRISPLVAERLGGAYAAAGSQAPRAEAAESRRGKPGSAPRPAAEKAKPATKPRDFTNHVKIGSEIFEIVPEKKRKKAILVWENFSKIRESFTTETALAYKGMIGVVMVGHKKLLDGEKLETIIRIAHWLEPLDDMERGWPQKKQFSIHENLAALVDALDHVLQVSIWKAKQPELGFVALFNDGEGLYQFRLSRGFHTALNESLASLEGLIDEVADSATPAQKEKVSALYRKLSSFFGD